jgi:hypothetical protein
MTRISATGRIRIVRSSCLTVYTSIGRGAIGTPSLTSTSSILAGRVTLNGFCMPESTMPRAHDQMGSSSVCSMRLGYETDRFARSDHLQAANRFASPPLFSHESPKGIQRCCPECRFPMVPDRSLTIPYSVQLVSLIQEWSHDTRCDVLREDTARSSYTGKNVQQLGNRFVVAMCKLTRSLAKIEYLELAANLTLPARLAKVGTTPQPTHRPEIDSVRSMRPVGDGSSSVYPSLGMPCKVR